MKDLPAVIEEFTHHFFPTYIPKRSPVLKNQNFEFEVVSDDISGLINYFFPDIHTVKGINIRGKLDQLKTNLSVTGKADLLKYKDKMVSRFNFA
ncbi:MAG: hypothetical protein IH946_06530, partial [Bacteroidetes bacterium]|nr:hypothetical protein [Bacteroidota bacterium]